MKLPIRSRIPDAAVRGDIRWLEIAEGDGGHYLFQFTDPEKPCKWDSFYNSSFSLEEILSDCRETFGIDESAWTEVDDR